MSDTTALHMALDRCLAAGETAAVATIVRRRGSSPREVGAKMLIRANGDTDGTVGSGCGEADVWRAVLDVMAEPVLVTRGHAHDVRSLRKIVDKPAAYIGMIGSRRRVFAVFKLLREEGVPIETLLRIHAPIGLDIETETPGEIAVSIGAEILKARRGGRATSLSDRMHEQHRASLLKGAAPLIGISSTGTLTFFVQRLAAGDFRVDFVIKDRCHDSAPFRTFVGGGRNVP